MQLYYYFINVEIRGDDTFIIDRKKKQKTSIICIWIFLRKNTRSCPHAKILEGCRSILREHMIFILKCLYILIVRAQFYVFSKDFFLSFTSQREDISCSSKHPSKSCVHDVHSSSMRCVFLSKHKWKKLSGYLRLCSQ